MVNDITTAYNWAVSVCNETNVGYSQNYRNAQVVNGIRYYDCSSFIWYALAAGGFPINEGYKTACGWEYYGNAITTAYECPWLLAMGFTEIPISDPWLDGDIVWKSGHTEMVYDGANRITMGAHTSNTTLENQVSINSSPASSGYWTRCFRYEGGSAPTDWIKGNRWLSEAEMQNNARIIYDIFNSYGWSINAIAGMLGNMEIESTINPGIWQNLDDTRPDLGFGLVQWTPSTNFTDWADANGYDWDDGDAQCYNIEYETIPAGEWIPTSEYPLSFADFKVSTDTPENLAYAFMNEYERPRNRVQPARKTAARKWYNYLNNIQPVPPSPPSPHPVGQRRKMPVYLMLRRRELLW